MALGDFTRQIAKEALLSATAPAPKEQPAAGAAENLGATIFSQIQAMQKALKEDEELVVLFGNGAERIRVIEIFLPSRQIAVLTGPDADRSLTRVISPVAALQLVCKVAKAPAGAKPVRVNLVTPKS
ncbi:MAG TPA: hypothetical protein VME43_16400 [Bryobacteraceae bacterium]|nr:hypothetical protein [Bryobacteraceae bacterium]